VVEVSDEDQANWLHDNSTFSGNIVRKSKALMGGENSNSKKFSKRIVRRYLEVESLLERLRADYPDLYMKIEDCARAQLNHVKDKGSLLHSHDNGFINEILDASEKAFAKFAQNMSDSNIQSLAFGYLAKWMAECFMDFLYEDAVE